MTIMNNTAVLFDFDGTLVDSDACIHQCFLHMFETYGKKEDFTEQLKDEVLGPPLFDMLHHLFPNQDPYKLVQEYGQYQLKDDVQCMIVCMPNCLDTLRYLKGKGYKIGVISVRKHDSILYHMHRLHMDPYIDVVLGADDVTKPKPNSEGIETAMKLLNVVDCVYVGDAPTDIQAAKNALVNGIAKIGRPSKKEALLNENPYKAIYDLSELKDLL